MKRILYLAMAILVAIMLLVPTTALAQDLLPGDDDPMTPEPDAVALSHEELAQIAGQPLPSQGPTSEPLPKTGGPEIGGPALLILPAALLLGLGALAYGVLRKAGERG